MDFVKILTAFRFSLQARAFRRVGKLATDTAETLAVQAAQADIKTLAPAQSVSPTIPVEDAVLSNSGKIASTGIFTPGNRDTLKGHRSWHDDREMYQ